VTPSQAAPAPNPQRIVAAGGVITEVLYALGAEARIVGVDATSLHPPQALRDKPNIGYVRALSPEGVLSLAPDRVIAIDNAGPPDALRLIQGGGVAIDRIPESFTPEGIARRIRAIGRAAGLAEAGAALADRALAEFAALESERSGIAKPRRVLFLLAMQNGRPVVGGRESGAAAMIALAGGVNAMEAVDGYKPVSDEAIIAARPDVIVMMQRAGPAPKPEEMFALPAFALTPAAATRALVAMDGLYLLGFGPRTPAAARDLMRAIQNTGSVGAQP
jgi:iron complex transport system substrate-binding protein